MPKRLCNQEMLLLLKQRELCKIYKAESEHVNDLAKYIVYYFLICKKEDVCSILEEHFNNCGKTGNEIIIRNEVDKIVDPSDGLCKYNHL